MEEILAHSQDGLVLKPQCGMTKAKMISKQKCLAWKKRKTLGVQRMIGVQMTHIRISGPVRKWKEGKASKKIEMERKHNLKIRKKLPCVVPRNCMNIKRL